MLLLEKIRYLANVCILLARQHGVCIYGAFVRIREWYEFRSGCPSNVSARYQGRLVFSMVMHYFIASLGKKFAQLSSKSVLLVIEILSYAFVLLLIFLLISPS